MAFSIIDSQFAIKETVPKTDERHVSIRIQLEYFLSHLLATKTVNQTKNKGLGNQIHFYENKKKAC
jgi:hypothetical protein